MKKIYSLFLAIITSISLFAQSTDIYESYAILNIKNAGNSYHDLKAATSNPDLQGANLGTYNSTETLVIVGAENNITKCNGGDVTGGNVYYRVYLQGSTGGSFTSNAMGWIFNADGVCGANSNQRWHYNTGTTNIISGLAAGTYVLEMYTDAPGSPSTAVADNAGNYYQATFTVTSNLSVKNVINNKNKAVFANGYLYTNKKGLLTISVYDFSGKLIQKNKINGNGNPLDFSTLPKGFFVMNIENNLEIETLKISK